MVANPAFFILQKIPLHSLALKKILKEQNINYTRKESKVLSSFVKTGWFSSFLLRKYCKLFGKKLEIRNIAKTLEPEIFEQSFKAPMLLFQSLRTAFARDNDTLNSTLIKGIQVVKFQIIIIIIIKNYNNNF